MNGKTGDRLKGLEVMRKCHCRIMFISNYQGVGTCSMSFDNMPR